MTQQLSLYLEYIYYFFQSHQKRHLENEVPIQQRLQITTIAQPSYYFLSDCSSLQFISFAIYLDMVYLLIVNVPRLSVSVMAKLYA